MLDSRNRRELLRLARNTIECALHRQSIQPDGGSLSAELRAYRASFVTLKCNGMLRGCIGTLEPVRQLHEDVTANAHAAAFRDPRFAPLSPPEADAVRIEISVLDSPEPLAVTNHRELLTSLRPGLDGLIVAAGNRRATFLPAVWESLGDPEDFIAHLWQKAGLARDSWPPGIHLLRYTTEHFEETGFSDDIQGSRLDGLTG